MDYKRASGADASVSMQAVRVSSGGGRLERRESPAPTHHVGGQFVSQFDWANYGILVMEDRHGALVDVPQDSTDFNWRKGSARIARLIGDHPSTAPWP